MSTDYCTVSVGQEWLVDVIDSRPFMRLLSISWLGLQCHLKAGNGDIGSHFTMLFPFVYVSHVS